MERYCGSIRVGSRRHPYISINNYVGSTIHLSQIELRYGVHEQLSLMEPASKNEKFLKHFSCTLLDSQFDTCPTNGL